MEARTTAILEATARGDFKLLHQAFGARVPLEEIAVRQTRFWREWRERLGEWKDVEMLGSGLRGPGLAVHARMNFERGTLLLRYVWERETLMGWRVLENVPAPVFLPQSATQFSSFDIRQPAPVRLRFVVAADGFVRSLIVESAGGTLTAERQGPKVRN